jgi:hypothetical protein
MMAPIRKTFLRRDEIALKPEWHRIQDITGYLARRDAVWRLDPLLHFIAVRDEDIAEHLKKRFGCQDATLEMRALVAQRNGVRVIGCERYAGMVVYNFADNEIYRVDTSDFKPKRIERAETVLNFPGLGRAAAAGVPFNFPSMKAAISAFKHHAVEEQRSWLRRHAAAERRTEARKASRGIKRALA